MDASRELVDVWMVPPIVFGQRLLHVIFERDIMSHDRTICMRVRDLSSTDNVQNHWQALWEHVVIRLLLGVMQSSRQISGAGTFWQLLHADHQVAERDGCRPAVRLELRIIWNKAIHGQQQRIPTVRCRMLRFSPAATESLAHSLAVLISESLASLILLGLRCKFHLAMLLQNHEVDGSVDVVIHKTCGKRPVLEPIWQEDDDLDEGEVQGYIWESVAVSWKVAQKDFVCVWMPYC